MKIVYVLTLSCVGLGFAQQTRVAFYPAAANIISGNIGDGVAILNNSSGNTISGNVIGTDLSGSLSLGNGGAGVRVTDQSTNNLIGGNSVTQGNYIANNQKGVVIGLNKTDLSVGNAIISNSIYSNAIIGIDLANDGRTLNHAKSPTPGPNDFQNYPQLVSYSLNSSGLSISWTLNSVPDSDFLLQFFSNQVNDPEGKILIATQSISTDASGIASGTVQVGPVRLNTPITATATLLVDGVPNDTSEFSPALIYGVQKPCPVKQCCNK